MHSETITETDELLIRRMTLAPGEKMYWHVDACHRFTVVIRGSRLAIEYRDSAETIEVDVHPGLAGWDAPDPRVHRAMNAGAEVYEEVVTFYRNDAQTDPQPEIP